MENKEQILKILKLVEDGKLTPEEAEEIITAMKEADAGESTEEHYDRLSAEVEANEAEYDRLAAEAEEKAEKALRRNRLTSELVKRGRFDELAKAEMDETFRDKLMEELHI